MSERVEVIVTTKTDVVDITADVDIIVKETEESIELDAVDAVVFATLNRVRQKAFLKPGKWNVRLMCIITENEEETKDE